MDKTVIKLGETEIKKHKFNHCKKPISINLIDIKKV